MAKKPPQVDLTPEQWVYLEAAFLIDQQKEADVRADGAAGHYEQRPARIWRLIRVAGGFSGFGTFPVREQAEELAVERGLAHRVKRRQVVADRNGKPSSKWWWNSGNASRWRALADRGLVELDYHGVDLLLHVRMTRKGRRVMRKRLAERT